jgi:hypothetical protein
VATASSGALSRQRSSRPATKPRAANITTAATAEVASNSGGRPYVACDAVTAPIAAATSRNATADHAAGDAAEASERRSGERLVLSSSSTRSRRRSRPPCQAATDTTSGPTTMSMVRR